MESKIQEPICVECGKEPKTAVICANCVLNKKDKQSEEAKSADSSVFNLCPEWDELKRC